jgi:hypothetical protein
MLKRGHVYKAIYSSVGRSCLRNYMIFSPERDIENILLFNKSKVSSSNIFQINLAGDISHGMSIGFGNLVKLTKSFTEQDLCEIKRAMKKYGWKYDRKLNKIILDVETRSCI